MTGFVASLPCCQHVGAAYLFPSLLIVLACVGEGCSCCLAGVDKLRVTMLEGGMGTNCGTVGGIPGCGILVGGGCDANLGFSSMLLCSTSLSFSSRLEIVDRSAWGTAISHLFSSLSHCRFFRS